MRYFTEITAPILIFTALLISSALAGGLIINLDSGEMHKVVRRGDTTIVYDLGPGPGDITIGKHNRDTGNTLIFGTGNRKDSTAETLILQDNQAQDELGGDDE